jgi:phytoene synthase
MKVSAADPALAASYQRCKELNQRHGKTYFAATRLLPAASRPHVHAVYGFCRYADDIVDDLGPSPVEERQRALDDFGARFFSDLATGGSSDPVLAAVVDTALCLRIDPEAFRRFLRSMAMDLTVRTYSTFDELLDYMDGSAAVIGEMMMPVLGAPPEAMTFARHLGIAFQLTNFLRDVGEDLDRGRVYLPADDVAAFGAEEALAERRVTPQWVQLLSHEIERAMTYYRSADRGIAMLTGRPARCVQGARLLYSRILGQIESNGFDVFTRRARVPRRQKAAVAARVLVTRG